LEARNAVSFRVGLQRAKHSAPLHVGEPLERERRPVERMSEDEVVAGEWGQLAVQRRNAMSYTRTGRECDASRFCRPR
jgi:hypothetical protein